MTVRVRTNDFANFVVFDRSPQRALVKRMRVFNFKDHDMRMRVFHFKDRRSYGHSRLRTEQHYRLITDTSEQRYRHLL
ncbi:hypothetical protein NDU88_004310 [Pleurodeles waltl]|uniref:Uncharacterized protein n=1 Tax=Pleurodeles waltl TaxID=8319 RepID=A0AAV7WRL6_PLEWA|nr:hypothetical protein NDU88_004310 [Pleurodeles waltl]